MFDFDSSCERKRVGYFTVPKSEFCTRERRRKHLLYQENTDLSFLCPCTRAAKSPAIEKKIKGRLSVRMKATLQIGSLFYFQNLDIPLWVHFNNINLVRNHRQLSNSQTCGPLDNSNRSRIHGKKKYSLLIFDPSLISPHLKSSCAWHWNYDYSKSQLG